MQWRHSHICLDWTSLTLEVVLVGSDLYWRLVTGRVVHGENGPAAIETVFGWVLSGPVDSTPELTTLATMHTLRIELYPSLPGCTGSGTWRPSASKIMNHLCMKSSRRFHSGIAVVRFIWPGRSHTHLFDDHYQLSLNRLTSFSNISDDHLKY